MSESSPARWPKERAGWPPGGSDRERRVQGAVGGVGSVGSALFGKLLRWNGLFLPPTMEKGEGRVALVKKITNSPCPTFGHC